MSSITHYLLFAGAEQRPAGGLGDLVGVFGSEAAARQAFHEERRRSQGLPRWAQLAALDLTGRLRMLCWFGQRGGGHRWPRHALAAGQSPDPSAPASAARRSPIPTAPRRRASLARLARLPNGEVHLPEVAGRHSWLGHSTKAAGGTAWGHASG